MKKDISQKLNIQKVKLTPLSLHPNTAAKIKRTPSPSAFAPSFKQDELSSLREAAQVIQRIRIDAQHELELARKLRNDAQKYQQESAIKARSEAQQLILRTRLATQKETEELIRQAGDEIQKVLADIRIIRIMAQEELAAQRKFTNAAKLRSMSMSIQNELAPEKSNGKKKHQLVAVE